MSFLALAADVYEALEDAVQLRRSPRSKQCYFEPGFFDGFLFRLRDDEAGA